MHFKVAWKTKYFHLYLLQKQPPEVFCIRRRSKKFRIFYKETPVLESLFNKVASLKACNFIKKILQHNRCFAVKFAKFLLTPIFKSIYERLLLFLYYIFMGLTIVKVKSSRPEVFLKISQNSWENTCTRVSFLIRLRNSGLQLY